MNTSITNPLALIIEDNDSLTDIFTQAMKLAGFEIQTVADGLQAIDRLGNLQPAVIILDLYLPGVTGDRVLSYIRNNPDLKNVIIVLTTFDSLLAEKLREQSDYVLVKPVSFGQLRDLGIKLRASLDQSRK
jgi:DNA-binding response OmpR family regulator